MLNAAVPVNAVNGTVGLDISASSAFRGSLHNILDASAWMHLIRLDLPVPAPPLILKNCSGFKPHTHFKHQPQMCIRQMLAFG